MNILEFYYKAYDVIIESGYADEVDWADSIKDVSHITSEEFFLEYVWVVLNAGMKEQIAKNIYANYIENFDIDTIKHPTKRNAIHRMRNCHAVKLQELLTINDKIDYLETLPWIGPITKYHLARNIGIDCVKPDRHMVRLTNTFGFETPIDMCLHIQNDNGTKLGTIDMILWRFCNLNGSIEVNDEV